MYLLNLLNTFLMCTTETIYMLTTKLEQLQILVEN